MKIASLRIGLFLLCLALSAQAAFRAGVAVRTVNPDPLLPVSGGVGPSHAVTNRFGDLTVRALIFDDGTKRLGFLSVDFLGFPAVLGDKVRSAVAAHVAPSHLLISATHTHSAPDCYGFPDGNGGSSLSVEYVEDVCAKAAEAVVEACAQLQEVSLKIGTGEVKGRIAYNYYAEHLYDPRCHVIQAVDASGQAVATLVNFAIHPEIIGSERGICSPDLVGPLYDRIREKNGGIGVFINSAQGGMVTADNRLPDGGEVNTWAECQRIGKALADAALRIASGTGAQREPSLYCTARKVSFPVDSPLMRRLLQQLPGYAAGDGSKVTTQLNLINVGDAQIVTIPGEALPNIGYFLKRKMRGKHNFLFGLTNDAFGYILSKEDFDSFKRYEYVTRTSLGERTGEILVNEILAMVQASPVPQARN